jgi:hypothetical protein
VFREVAFLQPPSLFYWLIYIDFDFLEIAVLIGLLVLSWSENQKIYKK